MSIRCGWRGKAFVSEMMYVGTFWGQNRDQKEDKNAAASL